MMDITDFKLSLPISVKFFIFTNLVERQYYRNDGPMIAEEIISQNLHSRIKIINVFVPTIHSINHPDKPILTWELSPI